MFSIPPPPSSWFIFCLVKPTTLSTAYRKRFWPLDFDSCVNCTTSQPCCSPWVSQRRRSSSMSGKDGASEPLWWKRGCLDVTGNSSSNLIAAFCAKKGQISWVPAWAWCILHVSGPHAENTTATLHSWRQACAWLRRPKCDVIPLNASGYILCSLACWVTHFCASKTASMPLCLHLLECIF